MAAASTERGNCTGAVDAGAPDVGRKRTPDSDGALDSDGFVCDPRFCSGLS
jgi:hypothetical protein